VRAVYAHHGAQSLRCPRIGVVSNNRDENSNAVDDARNPQYHNCSKFGEHYVTESWILLYMCFQIQRRRVNFVDYLKGLRPYF
jgi:hypothetical protein